MTDIAWTGHRPKDLDIDYFGFAQAMEHRYDPNDEDPISFITGGALGIDSYATEWGLSMNIPVHIILPFEPHTMARFWSDMDYANLQDHIQRATSVTILGGNTYDVALYQKRNEAMVNRADALWTYWTGKTNGGTANCIRYALAQKKPVFNIRTGEHVNHL